MSVMGDWPRYGACRGSDLVDDFYAAARGAPGRNVPVMQALCASCPVFAECKDWSLRHEKYGIWAGMTENQRKLERRRLGIKLETPEVFEILNGTGYDALRGPRKPIEHGTTRGYQNELKNKLVVCAACREANRLDTARRRAEKKALENA